jgi:TRAP-type mannitol/chloroaromatic compound transport system substrate-binding protein
MKFARALTLALAVAAGAASTASSPAKAQEFTWKIATFDSETGSYWNNFLAPYVEYVDIMTEGRVKLEPLPGGTLGSIFKIYEQVDDGLVEMAMMPPAFLGTKDPMNAIILGYPTGLGVDSLVSWLYYGGGEEILQAHRADKMGMHSMVLGAGPSEIFAHSHFPITTIEDLKGKKYRTLGNWAAIVQEKFGGTPTTVPGPEIYGLLEKKGLDMTEYSTPSENLKLGYQEVAPYIIYPGIHAPAFAFEAVAKLETWNELPDDLKEKMTMAARLATYEGMNRFIIKDLDAMASIQAGENTLQELSDAFQEKATVGAREWAIEKSEAAAADGNPYPLQAINSIIAFQDKWRANSKYMVVDHR